MVSHLNIYQLSRQAIQTVDSLAQSTRLAIAMHIDSYGFGHIKIDGKDYTSDLVITPGGVRAEWWRKGGHEVSVFDLAPSLTPKPEILIIGTGASGMCEVLREVEDYCAMQGIALMTVPTPEAVVEYNSLENKDKAVCALHLTC